MKKLNFSGVANDLRSFLEAFDNGGVIILGEGKNKGGRGSFYPSKEQPKIPRNRRYIKAPAYLRGGRTGAFCGR